MGEEVAVKYLDVDSTYRNRNNYPNPYDFVIPYSFPNKGSTSLGFFDAVLDSSPYTGSPTLQPGQLVTEGAIFLGLGSGNISSTTTEIQLDFHESPIENFYVNSTLQLGSQFRTIISYSGTTKVCVVSQPFFAPPPSGTVYYIRKEKTYFDSDIAIYNIDRISNTVNQLNLLTAAPSPVKDFYQGSYIRFTNGVHVGETALITKYDPFGLLVSWDQQSNPGANTFISTIDEQGALFTTSVQGSINTITLNLTAFESTNPTRTIRIKVRIGSGLEGTVIYNTDFPVTNNFVRSDYEFKFAGGPIISPSLYYTLTVQDVTVGGQSTGFINIFGIVPSTNSTNSNNSNNFIAYNTSIYPKMSLIVNDSALSVWTQPVETGMSDYIDTSIEKGFRIIPVISAVINSVTITMISFETVSSGRTITLKIRNGEGVNGTILFQNNYIITNTASNATDKVIQIIGGPLLTLGNSYTVTLVDITSGGTSTGFINLFGITSDINNVSYNSTVYPKFNVTTVYDQTAMLYRSYPMGKSTALSADGTTLAVGAPDEPDGSTGMVYIYIRSGIDWVPQQTLIGSDSIIPPTSVNQGYSVDLSDDGNTCAFGGINDGNGSKVGATWVFIRVSGVWTQQGSKLVGSNSNSGDNQGSCVSLSSDGNTLAIGGPGDGIISSNGNVWIFTRSSGIWTQEAGPIRNSNSSYVGWRHGFSVALSSDGNTLVYGAPVPNGGPNNQGAGFVYTRSGGIWSFQSVLLGPGGPQAQNIQLGYSCSLSNDGDTCSLGANTYNNNIGSTFIYTRSSTIWTQQDILIGTPYGSVDQQGYSCSLSGDGNILVTGAGNAVLGAIWVFTRIGTTWSQLTKLIPIGPSLFDPFFGCNVSISSDGLYISTGSNISSRVFIFSNGLIYTQPSNPVISSLITSTEQGFKFIPSSSGTISNITLTLSSFEALSSGRTVTIKIRDGSGVSGSVVYSGSFVINNANRVSNSLTIGSGTINNSDTYTLTLQDTTSGGISTGNLFIYGITPTSTYVSYNTTTYPHLLISASPSTTSFIQSSSPTISSDISNVTDQGFYFSPVFSGKVSQIIITLTSFGVLGYRTVDLKILSGSGLGGSQIYSTTVNISNTSLRTQYSIDLINPESLNLDQPYTLVFRDITLGGITTGNITIYGISQGSPYNSYNTTVYPRMTLRIPSFIITISPPKSVDGFINNPISLSLLTSGGTDGIEFNSQAHENATTLFQNGVQANKAHYYKIGLKYLVIPNQILNVGRGGRLDNYPYIYVQIYNDGNRGALNIITSDNPNAALAVFKCPIDKNLYNRPTSFFTLKTPNKDQIVKFRPDHNIRITLTLPDGTIISNQLVDNLTPLFPNPLTQVNGLFTLLPIDKYDHIPIGV